MGQQDWRFMLFAIMLLLGPFIYICPIVYAYRLYKDSSGEGYSSGSACIAASVLD